MRNLAQYPITSVEILDQLEQIQVDARKEGIGSTKPLIRRAIKNYFDQNPECMLELVESLKVK